MNNKQTLVMDYQKRENRMKSQGVKAHFDLADSDDFFGFDSQDYKPVFANRTGYRIILAILALFAVFALINIVQGDCITANNITLCD